MIGEDNEKQDKTKQLAAISPKTRNYSLCGEQGGEPSGTSASRQTERKKTTTKILTSG